MTDQLRSDVRQQTEAEPSARLTAVLRCLDIVTSSWYRQPIPLEERRRPGPKPKPIPKPVEEAVVQMATENPWYGYQRIAVMCRRESEPVTDRQRS